MISNNKKYIFAYNLYQNSNRIIMKNLNLILGILFVFTVSLKSQVVTQVHERSVGKGCKINTDKNKVAFCNCKTDTLTVDQISKCNELNVVTDAAMEIVSYSIVFRFGKDNIYEYKGTGKNLPQNVIDKIIESDIAYFWVENVKVKKDGKLLDIGTRKFYLKS